MTIEELAIAVYKQRLEDSSNGAVARMIAADGDNGEKLAARAKAYRPVVRAVIQSLEAGGIIGTT